MKLHKSEQIKMAMTRSRLDREAAWQVFIVDSAAARMKYRARLEEIRKIEESSVNED